MRLFRAMVALLAICCLGAQAQAQTPFFPDGPPPPISDIVGVGGFPPNDWELTIDDYTAFLNAFAAEDLLADVVGIGGLPPGDGLLTIDDYTAFINDFVSNPINDLEPPNAPDDPLHPIIVDEPLFAGPRVVPSDRDYRWPFDFRPHGQAQSGFPLPCVPMEFLEARINSATGGAARPYPPRRVAAYWGAETTHRRPSPQPRARLG